MSARLINSLTTASQLAALFSDESILQAMLDFEVARLQTNLAWTSPTRPGKPTGLLGGPGRSLLRPDVVFWAKWPAKSAC